MEDSASRSLSPFPNQTPFLVHHQEPGRLLGKRKVIDADHEALMAVVEECFTNLESTFEQYSQPLKSGENNENRSEMQTFLCQRLQVFQKRINPLMLACSEDMLTNKKLKSLNEEASSPSKEKIEINEQNLFSQFDIFKLIDACDLEKLELFYEAFCQYSAKRKLPQEIKNPLTHIAAYTLKDKAYLYFKVGTKVFGILKIDLLDIKSFYFTSLIDEGFIADQRIQHEPLLLEGISEEAFQEVVRFIGDPKNYHLPILEGEAKKNLLIELVERAHYFELDKLRKKCEMGLEAFVNENNAKEMYRLGLDKGVEYPILQQTALDRLSLLGVTLDRKDDFIIKINFFDNVALFPLIRAKRLNLSPLKEGVSSTQFQALAKIFLDVEEVRLPIKGICSIQPKDLRLFPKLKSIDIDISGCYYIKKNRQQVLEALTNNNFQTTIKEGAYGISFERIYSNLASKFGQFLNEVVELFSTQIDKFDCMSIKSTDIYPSLSKLPCLKSLTISACQTSSILGLKTLCPHLEKLLIHGDESKGLLEVARRFTQIEDFAWVQSDGKSKIRDLSALPEFRSLKKLHLNEIKEIEIDQLIEVIPSLVSCQQMNLGFLCFFDLSAMKSMRQKLLNGQPINEPLLTKLIYLLLKAPPGMKISIAKKTGTREIIKSWAVYRATLTEYRKIMGTLA